MNEIRLVIADDHPIFRRGLRHLLDTDPGLFVVGEAENGRAAMARIAETHPDVAILDVDMPEMDAFEVVRGLREARIAVRIVFLTMHKDEDIFNEALDSGIDGYVLKDSAATDIIDCVRAVHAGNTFISPQLSSFLLTRRARASELLRSTPTLAELTPTERRVLALLAENRTSRDIANVMCISVRTVENHRARICAKLDLRGSHALLKFALDNRSALPPV